MRVNLTKAKKFVRQLQTSSTFKKRASLLQTFNMIILGFHYGFSPLEYYLYGFDKENITRKEKLSFISNEKIIRIFRPTLNNKKWIPILLNKLLFFLFYSKFGLPVAKVYGFYYPGSGFFLDGSPLRGRDDFLGWQNKSRIKNMVIKPVGSLAGKGIMVFDKLISPKVIMCNDGSTYGIDDIFSFMDNDIETRQTREDSYMGYIIEERIEQDSSMDIFGGSSLNTVRISTLRTKKSDTLMDFAMLRVGKEGSLTDNLHQGGYVVNIDVRNGNLGKKIYGYKGKHGPWIEEKSVRINELFKDGKVPFWEKIVSLARKAVSFSPELCSVGWDIAISKHGPVLMEGNDNWDMIIAQVLSGGYLTDKRRAILREYGMEFPT